MTDRISTLLHEANIATPPAPIDAIVRRGRTSQRRRSVRRWSAGVVASLTVVTGLGIAPAVGNSDAVLIKRPPASAPLNPAGWAVAAGRTIHLGNGVTSTLPKAIKGLYYTSAGTVVRTGRSPYPNAADSSYALVTDDGRVTSLGLSLGDRAASTDPTLPYLAYAERGGTPVLRSLPWAATTWNVVLRDVRTGHEVASIPVEGAFTWGGWEAPPVALDGDYVYVGLDDQTLAVNWRTGASRTAKGLPASTFPTVTAGHEALEQQILTDVDTSLSAPPSTFTVVDATTGAIVRKLAEHSAGLSMSPDGQWVVGFPMSTCLNAEVACSFDASTSTVTQLSTGRSRPITIGNQAGWTPAGDLIVVEDRKVSLCQPATGTCQPTGITLGDGIIRVGGNSYES